MVHGKPFDGIADGFDHTGGKARKPQKNTFQKIAAVPHSVWTVMFIVAPMLFVLYFAFTDASGNFSLSNIAGLSQYTNVFILSIAFALIATVVCLLIGYPVSYIMSREGEKFQRVAMVLIMLPMWMNFLVRTYSLTQLLDNNGLINQILSAIGIPRVQFLGSPAAVILGMVYNYLPFMVLPIYTGLSKIDRRYLEASMDLGCTPLQTIFKVVLPLSISGVISGITMVFVPSISTFYISQKLGGGSFDLIGDTIERQFQNAVTYHTGAAISLVMMILIFISLAVMNKFSDGGEDIIV